MVQDLIKCATLQLSYSKWACGPYWKWRRFYPFYIPCINYHRARTELYSHQGNALPDKLPWLMLLSSNLVEIISCHKYNTCSLWTCIFDALSYFPKCLNINHNLLNVSKYIKRLDILAGCCISPLVCIRRLVFTFCLTLGGLHAIRANKRNSRLTRHTRRLHFASPP